ncbi:cysteine-rich receptor-like protein kinase 10 isoform X2 [Papaver somniferum]|nr:cysteine-rich receptor-like protein kinase 10 isoform X2 [Papaver somniferum]
MPLIKKGFTLEWHKSPCTECQASGGYCGVNEKGVVVCFCKDGPYQQKCENKNNSSKLTIRIAVPFVIAVLFTIAFGFFYFGRKKTQRKKFDDVDDEIQGTESLQFNFSTICVATNNFSEANKLGQGGFGSVYKGTLSDMQEIAVKRLSKNSGQGEQEFKNEVTLVAKLQHRNLVKLVGFSQAGEEKLLIYEFMPNGSLDQILFDPVKCTQLDWERRYKLIGGVARGLVYLHEESRLKIIHRDLKASNILLDADMNPKIADFGMARLFCLHQIQDNTNRIVGTYGYMAPEYIMHGEFSMKSDVFSFGVLVLEILCGQRNSSFHKSDIAGDLLSYAWRHWNNGSAIEILHPTLKDTFSRKEAVRCIHVALLCVQKNVEDRPSMQTVILMLNRYFSISHNLPSAPAFFAGSIKRMEPKSTLYSDYRDAQGSSKNESIRDTAMYSVNDVSVTELHPR